MDYESLAEIYADVGEIREDVKEFKESVEKFYFYENKIIGFITPSKNQDNLFLEN